MTQNKQAQSRLSSVRALPELAQDNPLTAKTPSLTGAFEQERCPLHARQLMDNAQDRDTFKRSRRNQLHGSPMVQKHKPYPELKPSPALSHRVKVQTHYRDLAQERKAARHTAVFTPTSQGVPMETTSQQQQSQPQTLASNNRPDLVIRDGRLKATIWRNEGERGTYWTTSFAKTITGQDGNPRDIQAFSQTELLRLGELGREAYTAINQMKQGLSQEQSQHQSKEDFKQSRRQSNTQNIQRQSQGY